MTSRDELHKARAAVDRYEKLRLLCMTNNLDIEYPETEKEFDEYIDKLIDDDSAFQGLITKYHNQFLDGKINGNSPASE